MGDSRPKVKLRFTNSYDDYGLRSEIEVFVDGETINPGGDGYGGEPEDNSRWRDYKWVESLIARLAERLGAEVEIEEID